MHFPTIFKSRLTKRVAQACFIVACIAILMETYTSTIASRPSSSTVGHWEGTHGPILPIGVYHFTGHWQNHDIGVQIFSFGVPADRDCDAVFDEIASRLPSFRVHERSPNEIALRRKLGDSDARGFDEYRFVCNREATRIYGMFANLDSEMVMHPELVRKLHEISSGKSE